MKIRKTRYTPPPPLLGAAGLNKFRTGMITKLTRDMQPPNPSFQNAMTSPAGAIPQIIKNIIIVMISLIFNKLSNLNRSFICELHKINSD